MPEIKEYDNQPNEIASYNYTDLAENNGTVEYYGCVDEAVSYFLSPQQVYSSLIEKTAVNINVTFNSTLFGTPRELGGTAFVEFCTRTIGASTSNVNIILSLVSDSTTTVLLSLSGSSIAGTDQTRTHAFRGTIEPTHVKIDDYVKLNVFGISTSGTISVGTDPMNRDGTYLLPSTEEVTTQMKLKLPFILK